MKPENGNLLGSFPLKKMYSQKIHVEKLRKRVNGRGVREKETWINIAQRASRKNKRKRERREHEGKKKKKKARDTAPGRANDGRAKKFK